MNDIVWDIESDGFIFESKKIWTICLTHVQSGEKLKLNPFKDPNAKEKFISWVFKFGKCPNMIGHFILGFDCFVVMNILEIPFTVGPDTLNGSPVKWVDTFYLSMFLNPDRQGHSIEDFGQILGLPKIDYRQKAIEIGVIEKDSPKGAEFMQWTPEMDVYCERDVDVNIKVYHFLKEEWKELYNMEFEHTQAYRCGQKSFYLMSCQELAGWKFDIDKANKLKQKIEGMMEGIRAEVEPQLPPRSLKKAEEAFYRMPAKPYKKDGTYSSSWYKFVEKHSAKQIKDDVWEFYGKRYLVEAGQMLDVQLPMEMANQDQMKEWFLESGWKPSLWNFQRGPDGKPVRDPKTRKLIQTSPKIQEAGKICPNLMKMEGDLVKLVVKWLSLRNRLSVLKGWLDNPRLQMDGRLGAGRTGIAATHRQKHKTVVNVPKASEKVLLGAEFRELFTSEDGYLIAAGDAAALEGRVMGHYTTKYDNGATAFEILEGDPHSKNAVAFYGHLDEVRKFDIDSPDFSKDHPIFKPYRDRSKNGFYCLPMHTKVLTANGWKNFEDLEVGDKLPTFNDSKGIVEDDEIKALHNFKDTEVFEFSNKTDKFQCTDNHRWYGWRRSKSRGRASKKVFGWFEAKDFTQEHNILLTAPYYKEGGSKVTPSEARLMGYILSDGSYSWSKLQSTGSSCKGDRKAIAMSLAQSKNKYWEEIEELLVELNLKFKRTEQPRNNGNSVYYWKISQPYAREFIDRVVGSREDKNNVDWTSWVMKLSRESLEAFYEGFYRGDGLVREDVSKVISQNTGKIHEAVVTASQLLGEGRVTINRTKGSICELIRVQKRKHITLQEQSKKSLGIQETFCLTTGNGSFIIWQDDFIGITGNCILYGGGGPKVASTLGLPEKMGNEKLEAFWEANPAIKALKDNLEIYWEKKGKSLYLPAIDGRILRTRKKSALLNTIFQSCGGIVMDYACCFLDHWLGGVRWKDRKPYYLYKGCVVRRIGYMHDEVEFECEEAVAQEVAVMIEKSIKKAGEYVKLKVELAGEGQVGKNWREVH